jgi:hypothetical protein
MHAGRGKRRGSLARELPLLLWQLWLFRLLPEHVMITVMLQADLCGLSLVAVVMPEDDERACQLGGQSWYEQPKRTSGCANPVEIDGT